jgi:hypothetical protein
MSRIGGEPIEEVRFIHTRIHSYSDIPMESGFKI